jgi:hypothetical protein
MMDRARERDIDFVIVTGAGASREFGANGAQLPLMGHWAEAVVKKLGSTNPAYLAATGLQSGMLGEQFEVQLGSFLRQVRAFPLIQGVLAATTQFQAMEPQLTDKMLADWHRQTEFHLEKIINAIHESLYEEFAAPAVDMAGAAQAYGWLLGELGVQPNDALVFATTNYDVLGELAIGQLGRRVDWGEPPVLQGVTETTIDVRGLIDGMPRYVPVLHLHGRVGWYRRREPDERLYATTVTQHQEGFGVPLVMLPDPDKVYLDDDVIAVLWQQFEQALARAKRVLIVGHSLNDRSLVRAVRVNVEPLDRLGVTVLAAEDDASHPHETAVPVLEMMRQELRNAAIIPLRFGRNMDASRGVFEQWLVRSGPVPA